MIIVMEYILTFFDKILKLFFIYKNRPLERGGGKKGPAGPFRPKQIYYWLQTQDSPGSSLPEPRFTADNMQFNNSCRKVTANYPDRLPVASFP
jgi:hypothetical protein